MNIKDVPIFAVYHDDRSNDIRGYFLVSDNNSGRPRPGDPERMEITDDQVQDEVRLYGFNTEQEALAFAAGVDMVNDGDVSYFGPTQVADDLWCVLIHIDDSDDREVFRVDYRDIETLRASF